MLLLVSGATQTVKLFQPHVGELIVPAAQNRPETLILTPQQWAMDNGAYSSFNPRLFELMLERFKGRVGCLFAACPDVVGEAEATLVRWREWARTIIRYGYKPAFILQDGCTHSMIPWTEAACLFIGGTTEWKLGREVRTFIAYARAIGLWTHMGRVNSLKRLDYAEQIGCQSVDGLKWSRWSKVWLPQYCQWLAKRQLA